ncbi:hypothetical protein IAI10_16665 [Clostridium sp. 19966]|nr:hypothetical protein [Clostridium sp. 19966]
MKSNNRTVRWAEEVDVGTGFVDSIRFEDYIKNVNEVYMCRLDDRKIDIDYPRCRKKETCKGCIKKSSLLHERVLGIACTCYEIKITKSDFKSNHGHNFVGNYNYYVIPKELYKAIENLVPHDVGVILYCGHGYLRVKKKSRFKEINTEDLSRFLYNALKKWCDIRGWQYDDVIEKEE